MYSRKIALSLAKQHRRCPPPEIREDPLSAADWKKHRALCPYCSEQKAGDSKAWHTLAHEMEKRYPPMSHSGSDSATPITPGELRCVRPPGLWREGYFYNPPMVLVIRKPRVLPESLWVAQVYHDIHMAGPGDLILTGDDTRLGPLFVECWNIYTLKDAFLGPALDRVSEGVGEAVLACQRQPEYHPGWAMVPRPLDESDPRRFFRELELEVAYTFSVRSVLELVTDHEKAPAGRQYGSPGEIQDMIRRAVPGIRWQRRPSSSEEAFALAMLPAEHLPLAAADKADRDSSANLVLIADERVLSIAPVPMTLHGQSGRIVLSGRIRGLPEHFRAARFMCFIVPKSGPAVPPERYEWKAQTGDFMVAFPHFPEDPWELRAAVVVETERASHECHGF